MIIHACCFSLTLFIASFELSLGFTINKHCSSSSICIIPCRRTSSSLHASVGHDEDPSSPTPNASDQFNEDKKKIVRSPLAMAAQDWLEDDDDDDELYSYWRTNEGTFTRWSRLEAHRFAIESY